MATGNGRIEMLSEAVASLRNELTQTRTECASMRIEAALTKKDLTSVRTEVKELKQEIKDAKTTMSVRVWDIVMRLLPWIALGLLTFFMKHHDQLLK